MAQDTKPAASAAAQKTIVEITHGRVQHVSDGVTKLSNPGDIIEVSQADAARMVAAKTGRTK